MCQGNKVLAQFRQLGFDESEASRKVQQRALHTENEAAFEEQVDPLVCEQKEKATEPLSTWGPAAGRPSESHAPEEGTASHRDRVSLSPSTQDRWVSVCGSHL